MKMNHKPSPPAQPVTQTLRVRPDTTRNAASGVAFRPDAKRQLYQRVLTCLLGEAKFYEKGTGTARSIERLVREVAAHDPEWVLKLAAYARQQMHLRTVSVFLLVLAAELPACKPFVRKWAPAIIRRADEPAEIMAGWIARHGDIGHRGTVPFPNSLKKGINDALGLFDEYQLEKYNRHGAVRIRDVLRVCRPDPGDRQALFKYLRWDWDRLTDSERAELPKIGALVELAKTRSFGPEAISLAQRAHATWEVLVSQFGNKAEVWDALDLPFMAGLRNLRNLLQAGSIKALNAVLEQLQDEGAIRRSQQFPFRFLSAYREVEQMGTTPQSGRVLAALARAMTLSVANLPRLPGVTAIAADNSGSMDANLSRKSSVMYSDIANVFAALVGHLSEAGYTMAFGTDVAPVTVNPADSILTNAQQVKKADTKGMATNGFLVPALLRGYRASWESRPNFYPPRALEKVQQPITVDRVLIFTDCQLYDSRGSDDSLALQMRLYRREVNPEARLYVFNLAGYGTTQIPKGDPLSVEIAGWSEQVLRFIPLFEQGSEVALQIVDRMTPQGVSSEGTE